MTKIILIGNYKQDQQESMQRFCNMLFVGFKNAGLESEVWIPKLILASERYSTNVGINKWLAYIDKWILYPINIYFKYCFNKKKYKDTYFHICDHSNSFYLRFLPTYRTSITCHDVLAIRGAMGFEDANCIPSSKFGKIMQKWILNNLSKSKKLIAVSHFTLNQLKDISRDTDNKNKEWIVAHNAFNEKFWTMTKDQSEMLVIKAGLEKHTPFILHVGSDLPRKNRKLLVDMLVELQGKWEGIICLAGHKIEPELTAYIHEKSIQNKVVNLIKPDHETLVALYSSCEAFIFPSFSEGFGWPLIEAQMCGAPVIASNIDPMPEVSLGSAIHLDPRDPGAFANEFLTLQNNTIRNEYVQRGFINVLRFNSQTMINAYLSIHGLKKGYDN